MFVPGKHSMPWRGPIFQAPNAWFRVGWRQWINLASGDLTASHRLEF